MVKAYNLETILAEKYETIIRRNIGTTRARDFYDLHLLYKLHGNKLEPHILKMATTRTASKRGSEKELLDWKEIIEELKDEPAIKELWDDYRKRNIYAREINYFSVIESLAEIGNLINT